MSLLLAEQLFKNSTCIISVYLSPVKTVILSEGNQRRRQCEACRVVATLGRMPTVARKEQKLGRDPSLEPQRKCHPANTLLLVFWPVVLTTQLLVLC